MKDGDAPIALVTGGARRVGRAIVLALSRAGCRVCFTYRSSSEGARALAIEAGCPPEDVIPIDLDDVSEVEGFTRSFAARLGRLDVLVHNASVYGATPIDTVSADEAMRHYRVNALAPLLLTGGLHMMLSRSAMRGGGSIVCMCDIHASDRPRKGHSAYAMSKAALEQMVRVLAVELAPRVRVNGVAPGVVAFAETGPDSDPGMQARYIGRVPMGRSGTPEEAAEAVRWLALDATYTTGEIVRVDGGRRLG